MPVARSNVAHSVALSLLLWVPFAYAQAPTIDPAEDAEYFGPPQSMLFWSPEQKVAGFWNIDRIF